MERYGYVTAVEWGMLMRPENRLKWLRERSRLTQREVAVITGIPTTVVNKHERATRGLSKEEIERYSRLYKVPTYQIFLDPDSVEDDTRYDQDGLTTGPPDRMEGFQELHPDGEPELPGLPKRMQWVHDQAGKAPRNQRMEV